MGEWEGMSYKGKKVVSIGWIKRVIFDLRLEVGNGRYLQKEYFRQGTAGAKA